MNNDKNTLNAIAAIEAETSLIGGLLLDNSAFDRISDRLKTEHFYSDFHRQVFAEISRQITACKLCDVVTVAMAMGDHMAELNAMAQYVPSAANIRRYADLVIERHKSRALMAVSAEISELASDHHRTIADRVEAASGQLAKLLDDAPRDDWVSAHEGMANHTSVLEDRAEGRTVSMPTGLNDLDEYLDGGLNPGELVIIGARPSMGKAQPLSAKVLTAKNGWVAMGGLEIGDSLASVDGKASTVVGVFPQGEKKVFRVTFSDGRSTECCGEHLWGVNHRKWCATKVLSTQEVMRLMEDRNMAGRLWIDVPNGEFGGSSYLPVDPWLLGALLGDGGLTGKTIRFSKTAEKILEMVRDALPDAVELVHAGGCDWRMSSQRSRDDNGLWIGNTNPLASAMQSLGLMGKSSPEKFIPKVYLEADRHSRLSVLRGLMDTDGWVEKHGSVRFSSSSQQLAKDVQALARSLGYWCSMREKATGYKKNGEYHPCLPAYVLTISGEETSELFLFDGKKNRCINKARVKHIAFVSIEAVADATCQCIAVSHPAHLYITDDYVVTHNTALGMTIGVHMAQQYTVGLLSMEMSHQEVNDRLTAMLGAVNLSHVKRPNRGLQWDRVVEGIEKAKMLNLHVSDQGGLNINQVRSKARNLKRLHGLNVLVVDYIGLMSGLDQKSNRNTQLEEISRGLKTLAKELGICVLCLAQLNRKSEERPDQMPMMSDLRDSGAIEQDADVIVFIKRPIMANPELGTEWQNYAKLSVAKNRQGRCGYLNLSYIGQQTKFGIWTGEAPSKATAFSSRRNEL